MGEVGEEKKQEPAGRSSHPCGDVPSCNTYNYGDALYWDARYTHEVGSFDWYQRYSALRPFVQKYVPTSGRVLMVGCGNAVISEDMVNDGYEDVVNIDISSVVINMMKKKYESLPQLKYLQMDVRDMSAFEDESFDSVIDKGTLDSLMCGTNGPISASQMLGEVSRLLKPGGTYILPDRASKDQPVLVLHQHHTWNLCPSPNVVLLNQGLSCKTRILTTYTYAKKWMSQVSLLPLSDGFQLTRLSLRLNSKMSITLGIRLNDLICLI